MEHVIWENKSFSYAFRGEGGDVTFDARNTLAGSNNPILIIKNGSLVAYVNRGAVFMDWADTWKLVLDKDNRLFLELHINGEK